MAMPPQAHGRFADESSSVAPQIRKYWEQLSGNERQQILFIDEPDLVKQLYKLNLSLLCVGLMQRHLKTPLRPVAAVKSATPELTAAAVTPPQPEVSIKTTATEKGTALETKPSPAPAAAVESQPEKTYELLEAMEFMDLGTGMNMHCF